jgi:hypothetical protein
MNKQKQIGVVMKTRNLPYRFGSSAFMPVLGFVLGLVGAALAQQAGPHVPPQPPWVRPPTPAPPPPPPATVAVPQVLTDHVPPQVTALGLTPIGPLNATQQLQLVIALPLRNQAKLDDFLRQLHDPQSPNYRRFLTAQEFADTFGPAESDYAGVIAFAQAHNLAVTGTWPNRTLVDVSGTVADIENALHVHLFLYQHPYEARQFRAPDVDPSVNLAVPLLHICGLNDYNRPWPANCGTGSGTNGSFRGFDFRNAYLPDAGSVTGSGQNVAIATFEADYYQSDITAYENACGLPNVNVQKVRLDSYNGNPNNHNGEVSLDIEMAIAMAPGLQGVVVYEGYFALSQDVMNQIAIDDSARQISCSWLHWIQPGEGQTIDQIFQQFAAQGQSFFQASGDFGAFQCIYGGLDPMEEQWLTDVGGTMLTTGESPYYLFETVWRQSGGGYGNDPNLPSSAIPWWQVGVPNPSNQGSTTNRNFPDVALTASCIWMVDGGNGESKVTVGTSAAAPLWAGVAATANQQAHDHGFPPLGFLNPALYSIGQGANYSLCFHDITTGNNTNSCSPTQFTAVAGYDLCTGWGTPKGIALINELIRVADGALGCGTFAGGSFSFAVDFGASSADAYIYWASDVTTPLANWTWLSWHGPGSGFWMCSDPGAGAGVTARFYQQRYGPCWRPTGFIRRQINPGSWDLIANPFDAPMNTLNGLFNPMPDGTYLPSGAEVSVQYTNGTWNFNTYTWSGSSWSSGGNTVTLSPGQGFMIYNPGSSPVTVTFAGLVRQGNLTNTIPPYMALYSSMVPQAGRLQTDLGYVPTASVNVYVYNPPGYDYYAYSGGAWWPSEPRIALGQSFVLQPTATNTWSRAFTTCQ